MREECQLINSILRNLKREIFSLGLLRYLFQRYACDN